MTTFLFAFVCTLFAVTSYVTHIFSSLGMHSLSHSSLFVCFCLHSLCRHIVYTSFHRWGCTLYLLFSFSSFSITIIFVILSKKASVWHPSLCYRKVWPHH